MFNDYLFLGYSACSDTRRTCPPPAAAGLMARQRTSLYHRRTYFTSPPNPAPNQPIANCNWGMHVVEDHVQVPSWDPRAAESTMEHCALPSPQKSFKIAPHKTKACLTCNRELCLQGGKDSNPLPLHLTPASGAGVSGVGR